MRRGRIAWIVALAALPVGAVATPAQAATNVYALQASAAGPGGTLVQYAIGPGGTLARLPGDIGLAAPPQDIAVTPDGRFAYVVTSSATETATSTILAFARTAGGRLEPIGPGTGAIGAISRGLVVNPLGTRIYYGHPTGFLFWRAINADGTLGAPNQIALNDATGVPAYAQFLAMSADGTDLYAADFNRAAIRVWQISIDPATGSGAVKSPSTVAFPIVAGGAAPTATGRMAIAPSGSHLYVAPDTPGVGIARWAIDAASGRLEGGAVAAPASDGYAEAAVALSASGTALWVPSAAGSPLPAAIPQRIRQFSVGAGGALAPLAPPVVAYAVASPARDAVASPDGASLYLGQDGVVGEWDVATAGTVSPRNAAAAGPEPGFVNGGVAISPSQAPTAAFGLARTGRTAVFDGRASADPDGTIVRYDWSFGDGTGAANGGPVVSHAYSTAGTHTVALTVTDADATSTEKLWTGTRMLRDGGPSARTTRSVTIPASALPRPRKGRSVTVVAVSGTIRVRVPGGTVYVPIGELTEIRLGSIVDARKGKARITSEVDAKTGRTQSSIFYDWYFRILQTKGAKPITEARLVKGSFAGCAPSRFARAAFAAQSRKRSRRKVRHLWGRGKGDFRTGGKRSSATVRGTHWLVEDRCDGTLTRVKTGRVDVRVLRTKKIVRLWKKKGRRYVYLAKAP